MAGPPGEIGSFLPKDLLMPTMSMPYAHPSVIYHDIDTRYPWRWVGGVQQGQEVPKQSIVFARPKAIQHLTGGKMQCPCERVLLILPWCHDLYLRTLRHPRRPDFGEEGNIEFIRKDHHLMRL